jgi:hypothetical protein
MSVSHSPSSKPSSRSWRDVLQVHPATKLFPPMLSDELKAVGEDIIKNGLTSPIVLWTADEKTPAVLLDGRNRLDAIEMVIGPPEVSQWTVSADGLKTSQVITLSGHVDPYVYVVSANIHRRHLTAEKKRELIAEVLKADPSKSDRQVAETVKASPTRRGSHEKAIAPAARRAAGVLRPARARRGSAETVPSSSRGALPGRKSQSSQCFHFLSSH